MLIRSSDYSRNPRSPTPRILVFRFFYCLIERSAWVLSSFTQIAKVVDQSFCLNFLRSPRKRE